MWYTPPTNNVKIPKKGERVPVFTTFVSSSASRSNNLVLSLFGGEHAHDVEISSDGDGKARATHKLFPGATLHIRLVTSSVTVTVVGGEADSIQVKLAFASTPS